MNSQLRVRVYNVGLGYCVYLRVPDIDRDVHILIDCGNKFGSSELLGKCIADLNKELPYDGEGKKRLDLLVATHLRENSIKGFQEKYFQNLKIERIWLSPAFNLATTTRAAIDVLCNVLPQKNRIQPLYVTADTPAAQLKFFSDPAIRLKVLAPMSDIERYYLGTEGFVMSGYPTARRNASGSQVLFASYGASKGRLPPNISTLDFKHLLQRMEPSAPAADGNIQFGHNLSVVLLLEWRGRRLLFPGDADWNEAARGKVLIGKRNGSWNVMWQERRAELSDPLDFLLVGFHGAANATPWTPKIHPINQILDHLLPLPPAGQDPIACAVVSTLRTPRWPSIPDPELMMEIGRRVANRYVRTIYREETRSVRGVPLDTPQPQRTDLEHQARGLEKPVDYIEINLDALP